jgi:hypothetical protein
MKGQIDMNRNKKPIWGFWALVCIVVGIAGGGDLILLAMFGALMLAWALFTGIIAFWG